MKKKVIINFNKLPGALKPIFKEVYEYGFDHCVQTIKDIKTGEMRKAVPLETEDTFYLILLNEKKKHNYDSDYDASIPPDLLDQGSDFKGTW